MDKTFRFNKYLLIFVILTNFVISTKVNAGCTSELIRVCFHQDGSSEGDRYCWTKAAGLNRFEVQYVGDDINNQASSVSMNTVVSNLYICQNSNLINCHHVSTSNHRTFFGNMSPSMNDHMSSWKLVCTN